jgi:Mg-chelatase subunit ChlD
MVSASQAAPPAPGKNAPVAKAAPTPASAPAAEKPAAAPVTTLAVPARVDTYVQPDGTGYFAITFPAEADLPRTAGHDIVVLFDTSASQIGEARARGLKTLRTLLSLCQSPDRICLMAVDIGVAPLTTGFVAPDSTALQTALDRLVRRVPLGATDFPLALERAAATFSSDEDNAKAVVYIGDGVSAAQLFTPPAFAKLTDQLVAAQIPVFSYGIGPRVDGQLLAALANYTGGTIVLDDGQLDPKEVGLFLAASARGPVAWVQSTVWPKSLADVYPRRLTPMRSDRETVVIGKGILEGPIEVGATGQSAGRPWQRRWSVAPSPSSDDYSYFPLLILMAQKDNGTTLPILGAKGLKQIGRLFLATAAELITLAQQALSTDNFDDADRLIDEALRRDPNDPEATALRREIAKRRADQKSPAKESKPVLQAPSGGKPIKDKSGKSGPSKGKSTPAKPGAAKPDPGKSSTARPPATAPAKPSGAN